MMQVNVPLSALQSRSAKFCQIHQKKTEDDVCLRLCSRKQWFGICDACYNASKLTVCPFCKDKDCKMPLRGDMCPARLGELFGDWQIFSEMNQDMVLNFSETELVVKIPKPMPTRGVSNDKYAPAIAFLDKDGNARVQLGAGEKFISWSVEMQTPAALATGVNMVRTMETAAGPVVEDLGHGLTWTRNLLYGDACRFPTLVGVISDGRAVRVVFATNPKLPGILIRSYNESLEKTAICAVDIPSGKFESLNDPRTLKLPNNHFLHVNLTVNQVKEPPFTTVVGEDGCVNLYFHAAPGSSCRLVVKTLTSTELEASISWLSRYEVIVGKKALGVFDLAALWSQAATFDMCVDIGHVWSLSLPGMPAACKVFVRPHTLEAPSMLSDPDLFWVGGLCLRVPFFPTKDRCATARPIRVTEEAGCRSVYYRIPRDVGYTLLVSSLTETDMGIHYFDCNAEGVIAVEVADDDDEVEKPPEDIFHFRAEWGDQCRVKAIILAEDEEDGFVWALSLPGAEKDVFAYKLIAIR